MSDEYRALRERLARTFEAFYDRFPSLLAIQRAAVVPVLEGRNVFVAAPTAGGKTEAAMAPLLQRILDRHGVRTLDGPALIYVSPTRALVNDVYRRLTVPVGRLGIEVGRKTGDHASLGKVLPQVLVTTPESLDSMIARMPKRLLPLSALVLDELHALDGGPRGDQLAALCARLRRILASRGNNLQVVMLSATIEDAQAVAARYADDPVVVCEGGRRAMTARVALAPFQKDPTKKIAELVLGRGGKVLVFANARADVEWCADKSRGKPPFGAAVFTHHGSLSKPVREHAERDFHHARTAVCFATSTLELGIDIGDIDHVVLYGVPPDIPSLLQRVGRGSRRADELRFLALARDRGEILRFRHMMHAAREGRLLTDAPAYDPSTALQQTASLMLQNPGHRVAPGHVLERLPAWQAAYWDEERFDKALMHAERWFRRLAERHYEPTETLEKAFRTGIVHANLGAEAEVEVLDEITGRVLGTIAKNASDPSSRVLLGGSARRVRERSDGTLVSDRESGEGEARFERKASAPIPMALATDMLAWLGLDASAIHRVEGEDDTIFVHGLGTIAGLLLHASAGDAASKKPGRGVAFGLRLVRGHQDWPAQIAEAARLELFAKSMTGRFARLFGFGPFFRDLPHEEKQRAVLAAVRPRRIAKRLQEASIEDVWAEDVRMQVRVLLAP